MKLSITAKQVLGFSVLILLILVSGVFSVVSFNTNLVNATHSNDESLPYALKGTRMKLAVVLVQQWLTDISATRAAEGFDDGFDEAETYAKDFKDLLKEFNTMFTSEKAAGKDTGELIRLTEDISEVFDGYYDMGKKMANEYIAYGPERGNILMEDFDPYAEQITKLVDELVGTQTDELKGSMANIVTTAQISMISSLVILAISVFLGILFAVIISRSISLPLGKISDTLKNSSSQLASSAQQISMGQPNRHPQSRKQPLLWKSWLPWSNRMPVIQRRRHYFRKKPRHHPRADMNRWK